MAKPIPATLDLDQLEKQLDANAGQDTWQTYHCTLVTPMYGGGVKAGEVDREMPVRATEIRGQLRFWWRLLNRNMDSIAMYKKEREIWGGLGTADELTASKVTVRIGKQPGYLTMPSPSENLGVKYVFGQGEANWLKDGAQFQIQLKYPAEVKHDVEAALRWWGSFGGLGAKTRRGFGAVHIKEIKEISDEELKTGGCLIARFDFADTAMEAWRKANDKLHKFRQGRGFAREQGKDRPGQSFWPEPDQLRRNTGKNDNGRHMPKNKAGNAFPRAAFGLPIIFDFRNQNEPDKTELLPAGELERMASPLILRPCVYENKWVSTAVLLPDWKKALSQPLRFKRSVGQPQHWPADIAKQRELVQHIRPMMKNGEPRGLDPLTAFMAFFEEDRTNVGKQICAVIQQADTWEKAKISFNRASTTVSAFVQGKPEAHARGDEGNEIWKKLSDVAKKKIANGFFQATAIVKGTELLEVKENK